MTSPHSGLEAVMKPPSYPHSTLEVHSPYSQPQEHPSSKNSEPQEAPSEKKYWVKNKWVWFTAVAIIVVVAIVGGVVGGLRNHQGKAAPASNPSSTNTSAPTRTSTVAIMSGTAIPDTKYYYPTAVSWGYPHLEVLTTTTSLTGYWIHRGVDSLAPLTWSSWQHFGGAIAPFTYSISAVSPGFGVTDIFVVGGGGTSLWHTWHNQSEPWGTEEKPAIWEYLDGGCSTAPSAIYWDSNRWDVFVLGSGGDVWTKHRLTGASATTWDWQQVLSGGVWEKYSPTVVSWGLERLDLFVVEPNNKQLYHAYSDGNTWKPAPGFESLGGYCAGRPIAVSWGAGRIDVFVRGGDSGLWHIFYSGSSWSTWASISGDSSIQGEPEALFWDLNRLDVFAWGVDGSLFHKWLNGVNGQWLPAVGFEILGSGLGGPPKGVSDAPGSLHVFSYSRFGSLQHISWNSTQGKWSPDLGSGFEQLGVPPGGI